MFIILLILISECRNYGDLRLQQTTTTNYDNGTASVSGILQFCSSYGSWRTVCENNFTDANINQFCNNLGYSSEYAHDALIFVFMIIFFRWFIVNE